MVKYFISCNSPISLNTTRGRILASCGKCVQCLQAKADELTLLLDLESSKHKYVEFLTNTYDNEHVPYIDSSVLLPSGRYPVVTPKRGGFKFNVNTGEYDFIPRKQAFQTIDLYTLDSAPLFKEYYTRIDKYFARFPSRFDGFRNHDKVLVIYKEDILLYIKRLKYWFKKNYGQTFRYYIICEYGSNSLRPHYHILLFHDSFEARKDFRDVIQLTGHTKENPRECCRKLYLSKVWNYGNTTTTCTDKHMSSYVSGYLTQHANLPRVLGFFPQKAFHSILLGSKTREQTRKLFKNRDWNSLSCDFLISKSNECRRVSVPSSTYAQFAVRFTGASVLNVDEINILFRASTKYAPLFFTRKGEIYDDEIVYKFMLWLETGYNNDYLLHALQSYIKQIARPCWNERRSINPLKSLLYASYKHYTLANLLGFHSYELLLYQFDLMRWLNYQRLKKQFKLLEQNPTYAYEYYSAIDKNTGTFDPDILQTLSIFRGQQLAANMAYT